MPKAAKQDNFHSAMLHPRLPTTSAVCFGWYFSILYVLKWRISHFIFLRYISIKNNWVISSKLLMGERFVTHCCLLYILCNVCLLIMFPFFFQNVMKRNFLFRKTRPVKKYLGYIRKNILNNGSLNVTGFLHLRHEYVNFKQRPIPFTQNCSGQ